VSPPSTTWIRCCGAGKGVGDGDGDGIRNGGGVVAAAGPGCGEAPALGVAFDAVPVLDGCMAQRTAKKRAITPTTSTAPRMIV
jgi:hypothetical protein